jgi:hypothetical protein
MKFHSDRTPATTGSVLTAVGPSHSVVLRPVSRMDVLEECLDDIPEDE